MVSPLFMKVVILVCLQTSIKLPTMCQYEAIWGWIRQTRQLLYWSFSNLADDLTSLPSSTLQCPCWSLYPVMPNSLQSCTHPTFPPHYICTSSLLVWYIHLSSKFQLRHHFLQEAYLDLMLQNESLFLELLHILLLFSCPYHNVP